MFIVFKHVVLFFKMITGKKNDSKLCAYSVLSRQE